MLIVAESRAFSHGDTKARRRTKDKVPVIARRPGSAAAIQYFERASRLDMEKENKKTGLMMIGIVDF